MRDISQLSGLFVVDAMVFSTSSLVADETETYDEVFFAMPFITALYPQVVDRCLGDNFCYRLPTDIDEERFQDEPIEIPVVKRMNFKFGKPQEKRFFV
ncbi:MAG: hypothetical protein LBQ66_13865 [Planctomycetaceae bacterium]|jgi:hypothetical protein|nr:hypothetical protein [Planctomycetaceae bacterium]